MLGLKKGAVKLLPHNEEWHQLFAEEKARLQKAVGENVLAIEHVGSTSICGIAAKPILDIAIAIEKYSDGEKCIIPLEKSGYEYRGENGIPGRHYFVKGEPRTHHLHMAEMESDVWRNYLSFRDYLRQNPLTAEEYNDLKKNLAEVNAENREAYLDGKSDFIAAVLRAANSAKRTQK